jgi:hypothetical protein
LRLRCGVDKDEAIVEFNKPASERRRNQVRAGAKPIHDPLVLEGPILFEHTPAQPAQARQEYADDQHERQEKTAERTEPGRGLHGVARGGRTHGL